MIKTINYNWVYFMKWITIIKVLAKHAKNIMKELKKEGGPNDPDSPNRLTRDEIAMVITDELLDSVGDLTAIFLKKK